MGMDEDIAPGFLLSVSALRMRVLFVFLEGERDGQWCAVAGPGCLGEFMVCVGQKIMGVMVTGGMVGWRGWLPG